MKASVLVSAVALLASQCPACADWRFCVAADHPGRKVYLTAPFLDGEGATPDGELDRELKSRRIRYDSVQCPRADDQIGAFEMRQHAAVFNREFGSAVIDLDWRPAGAVTAGRR